MLWRVLPGGGGIPMWKGRIYDDAFKTTYG